MNHYIIKESNRIWAIPCFPLKEKTPSLIFPPLVGSIIPFFWLKQQKISPTARSRFLIPKDFSLQHLKQKIPLPLKSTWHQLILYSVQMVRKRRAAALAKKLIALRTIAIVFLPESSVLLSVHAMAASTMTKTRIWLSTLRPSKTKLTENPKAATAKNLNARKNIVNVSVRRGHALVLASA